MCDIQENGKKVCPSYTGAGEEVEIWRLFEGSDVEFGSENILYIFLARKNLKIIFMTESYLLEFDPSMFTVENKKLKLTQTKNIPKDKYDRLANCLFNKPFLCIISILRHLIY